MRVRQTQDALGKESIHRRRIDDGIAENIVHRGQPRRIEVANARDLHGCGLICRDLQRLSARRMPREIKEDVDPVRINATCCILSGSLCEAVVVIGHPCHPLHHITLLPAEIIEVHLEARTVIRRKELDCKVQHNVIREARREIPDAQLLPPSFRM